MSGLRLLFAGSPAVAVPSLDAVLARRHEVLRVVTREDAPLGRKRVLTPTPVAAAAEHHGLPVVKANRLGPVAEELIATDADLGVIVAYGGFVREPLLSAPRHGWINLHFSLLPRWRGAAPVQHAVIAGDDITGANVFRLVEEMDAGPVLGTVEHPIGRNETAGHLLDALAVTGAELLARVVDEIAAGTAVETPQRGEPNFAPKLALADGAVDWALPAEQVSNRIRGVTPEPGSFTSVDGVRLKILEVALAHEVAPLPPGRIDSRGGRVIVGTATVPIELLTVLPAGKRAMPARDWWRGRGAAAPAVAQ